MNDKFTTFITERYNARQDTNNFFPAGISDAEFREFIIDYLLGHDWYVVAPLPQDQVNELALNEILKKYSKEYRKEVKKYNREMR